MDKGYLIDKYFMNPLPVRRKTYDLANRRMPTVKEAAQQTAKKVLEIFHEQKKEEK
jgi:hypothetical protein